MNTCPVCGSVMQSDGRMWRCPFSMVQTQYDKHSGTDRVDVRITVNPERARQ